MLKSLIHINPKSAVPKYRQVMDSITGAIEQQRLKVGDKLPSINELCVGSTAKRDTVMYALNELRSRGIIMSHHGKGYYVASTAINQNDRVFLLFRDMSPYAVNVFNGLVDLLPDQSSVDIFFHHGRPSRIAEFLNEKNGKYTAYILNIYGLETFSDLVTRLNGGRTCLIGMPAGGLKESHCVYHDFGKDMHESLRTLRKQLKKYCRLVYLCRSPQEKPDRSEGFKRFCTEEKMDYLICRNPEDLRPALYEAFIIPDDEILVSFMEQVRKGDFTIGENIGIVTFGESLLKEVTGGGLTTISYDYSDLCSRLIEISQGHRRGHVRVKPKIIQRNSL
jgi:DNA-binding transcriptional regulator YhcF (GntR family)